MRWVSALTMLGEFVYVSGLKLFSAGLSLASTFNKKAALAVSGRKETWTKIQALDDDPTRPVVWFHCASLGEFEQARPVIEAYKAVKPEVRILLTFFSPSGFEIRKNYPVADVVCYLPIDGESAMKRFVLGVRPKLAVFAKYEFWHYTYLHLQEEHVPIVVISALFRPEQVFFQSYGRFARRILRRVTMIFVQNESSAELLRGIRLKGITVAGDTRFDRVAQGLAQKRELPWLAQFKGHDLLFVGGSVWVADIELLYYALNSLAGKVKMLLAPHELDEPTFAHLKQVFKHQVATYSSLEGKSVPNDVVLVWVDQIGMLSDMYHYADMAYVGGAFSKGLHNILEAAAAGIPVMYGPGDTKHPEADDLANAGGGVIVKDATIIDKLLHQWLEDPTVRQKMGAASAKFVQDNTGATQRIMDYLSKISLGNE